MIEDRKIRLRSREGDGYEVQYRAAKLSKLVEDSLDEDEDDGEDGAEEEVKELEIPKVSSNCLSKVVQFMKHHEEEALADIITPLEGEDLATIITQEWYRDFVSADQSMIFELISAANYMQVQPLLNLACLRVSIDLVGKTAEEIRVILNIPKMTAEEEAKARSEHRWIFED